MIHFDNEAKASEKIVAAMKSGDETKMKEAWQAFHESVAEQVIRDFEAVQAADDKKLLAQRGYRQLTTKETKWYQKVIDAAKSPNPKQAFATILGSDEEDDLMPETIIQDVYRDLENTHPLLSKISLTSTGYATKWILNDHDTQTAVWGTITATITEEITSAFRVIDLTQNKLSCYAIIEKGMLDLGPTFLDGYIRRVLREAMAGGLEEAILTGDGNGKPIGLTRDVHEGVSVSAGVYPEKTANYGKHTVTDFTPASYGALVGELAMSEKGKARNVRGLTLVCNPVDYYTKVMPATTVLNANGTYVNNLFPVPTDVITSVFLDEGEAVLFLPDYYRAFAGSASRSNVIEYSDDYKFLEDQRVFKVVQYATGRAYDNTCSLLLDISGLKPAYLNVKMVDGTVTVANAEDFPGTTPTA